MPAATQECPECGYIFVAKQPKQVLIEHVDLVEIRTAQKAEQKNRKRRIAMARTFEELEVLRKEFGYKPGWTYMIMRERKPRHRPTSSAKGQDWTKLLSEAKIPEPPGYQETVRMMAAE